MSHRSAVVSISMLLVFLWTSIKKIEAATSSGALLRVAAQAARGAPVPSEPWQRSWEAYIDAYNECVKSPSCKPAEKFGKKRVQWEATYVELNFKDSPPSVKLSFNSTKGFDVSKPPTVFKVIAPEMRTSAIAAWKTLKPGSVVRFDVMIEESGGILSLFGLVGARFQDAFPLSKPR